MSISKFDNTKAKMLSTVAISKRFRGFNAPGFAIPEPLKAEIAAVAHLIKLGNEQEALNKAISATQWLRNQLFAFYKGSPKHFRKEWERLDSNLNFDQDLFDQVEEELKKYEIESGLSGLELDHIATCYNYIIDLLEWAVKTQTERNRLEQERRAEEARQLRDQRNKESAEEILAAIA